MEQQGLRWSLARAIDRSAVEGGRFGGFADLRGLGWRQIGFLSAALVGGKCISERAVLCLPDPALDPR